MNEMLIYVSDYNIEVDKFIQQIFTIHWNTLISGWANSGMDIICILYEDTHIACSAKQLSTDVTKLQILQTTCSMKLSIVAGSRKWQLNAESSKRAGKNVQQFSENTEFSEK